MNGDFSMPPRKAEAKTTSQALEEAYNEFPYESYVYPQTHPERMHTVAKLFGLNPPDIHKARILELGCAAGGNAMPLALLYPKTKILGIDISKEQITKANEYKKAMALKNIDFRQGDIMKLKKEIGEFDYIICHGVFSWVPEPVRDAIFKICAGHLSKNGIAVISYNTLPGWAAIKSLREMMLYHTKNFKNPAQQIAEAKRLLDFIYENTTPNNETYRQTIDRERKLLAATNDSYIFHEHLEAENHQFYFHDFAAMAHRQGLAYVGDSDISTMYIGNYSEKARKTLGAIKDVVQQEQYIDFLCNRRFRHSIVTRKENAQQINRNIQSPQIFDFYIQAQYKQSEAQNETTGIKFESLSSAGAAFTVKEDKAAQIFRTLAEMNMPVFIDELELEVKSKCNISPDVTRSIIGKNAFLLCLQGFITLHSESHKFAARPGKKPKAFSWALHVAQVAPKSFKSFANLRRENINLHPFARFLLQYLDGKSDRTALAKKMMTHVKNGDLKIHKDGKEIIADKELQQIVNLQVESMLNQLADAALLES